MDYIFFAGWICVVLFGLGAIIWLVAEKAGMVKSVSKTEQRPVEVTEQTDPNRFLIEGFEDLFADLCKQMNLEPAQMTLIDVKIVETLKSRLPKQNHILIENFCKMNGLDFDEGELEKLFRLFSSKGCVLELAELRRLVIREVYKQRELPYSQAFHDSTEVSLANVMDLFMAIEDMKEDCGIRHFLTPQYRVFYSQGKRHKLMLAEAVENAHTLGFLRQYLTGRNLILQGISAHEFLQKINDEIADYDTRQYEKKLREGYTYNIEEIDAMSGEEFEKFLEVLFSSMKFSVVRTPLRGDQGADLVLSKGGEKYVVQAKRKKGNVGNKAVQEIVASQKHYKATRSMVLTNSYFTNAADELAEANGVELIDRDTLETWIERFL